MKDADLPLAKPFACGVDDKPLLVCQGYNDTNMRNIPTKKGIN